MTEICARAVCRRRRQGMASHQRPLAFVSRWRTPLRTPSCLKTGRQIRGWFWSLRGCPRSGENS